MSIVSFIKFRYYTLIGPVKYLFLRRFYPFPQIMSIDETLSRLLESECSIARFGDGELNMIFKGGLDFQEFDVELSRRLREILTADESNECLVALPGPLADLTGQTAVAQKIWKRVISEYYLKYYKFFDFQRSYPNSFITRPYMDFADKKRANVYFEKLKLLWNGKNILIVEGENSKLGIGNDLFSKTKRIRRILTKSKHVFGIYDRLLKEITKVVEEKEIVILALGPTATILAYDLSKLGIRALDLGHVDIEYEWFLAKAESKQIVKGKDVNELNSFMDSNGCESDADLLRQVILKVL